MLKIITDSSTLYTVEEAKERLSANIKTKEESEEKGENK